MSVEIPTIKEIPAIRVLSIREKGSYDPKIEELMHRLTAIVFSKENQEAQLMMTGPPMYICHDEGYKEKDADIEVAFPIDGNVANPGDAKDMRLPTMKALSLIYKGPYTGIGEAYDAAIAYAMEEGLTLDWERKESREIYLTDPDKEKEENLLTEVLIPLK